MWCTPTSFLPSPVTNNDNSVWNGYYVMTCRGVLWLGLMVDVHKVQDVSYSIGRRVHRFFVRPLLLSGPQPMSTTRTNCRAKSWCGSYSRESGSLCTLGSETHSNRIVGIEWGLTARLTPELPIRSCVVCDYCAFLLRICDPTKPLPSCNDTKHSKVGLATRPSRKLMATMRLVTWLLCNSWTNWMTSMYRTSVDD